MKLVSEIYGLQDALNAIVCGDALEFIKKLPDKCIDTVVTSPPFWQQRDYACDGQIGLENTPSTYIDSLLSIFDEIRRVLKKNGSMWINIGDSYNENTGGYFAHKNNNAPHIGKHRLKTSKYQKDLPRRSLLLIPYHFAWKMVYEKNWCCRDLIIWRKKIVQPTTAQNRFTTDFEPIFLFTQGPKYYFDKESVKWIEETDDLFGLQRKERRSVWDLSSDHTGKTGHKAPYPLDLVRIPLQATCPEEGIVLDPFSGSGTTALAAKEMGRNFLACDLNPDFCKIAEKRLRLS